MTPKTINRRKFLKGTGIATILIAGGGVWRAVDQGVFSSGKGSAYEPWYNWEEDSDSGPLSLVKAAILSASPHNTQPWLFKVSDSRIQIFADTSRHLGAMDVYMREMHIGIGCAIENMLIAATAKGYKSHLTLSPGNLIKLKLNLKSILVATLDLSPGEKLVSDFYKAIPNRHTDRAVYNKTQMVKKSHIEKIHTLVHDKPNIKLFIFTSEEKRNYFTEGTIQSTKDIIADAKMAHDSAKWFRHDWDDVQKFKDGPYIDTAGVSPMMRVMVKMLPRVSEETENKYWLEATVSTMDSTPVMGLIAVQELYDRPQSIQAGQLWQRLHLWATTQGMSMQPVNQMLEVVDREKQLGIRAKTEEFLTRLIGESTWKPTFAFRLGYPTMKTLPSPRRSVKEILL